MKNNKNKNINIILENIEEENFRSNPSSFKSSRIIGDSENVSFSNISRIDISDSFSKSKTENKKKIKKNISKSIVFVKIEKKKKKKSLKKLNKSFTCKEDDFYKERSTSKIKVGHNINNIKKKKKLSSLDLKKIVKFTKSNFKQTLTSKRKIKTLRDKSLNKKKKKFFSNRSLVNNSLNRISFETRNFSLLKKEKIKDLKKNKKIKIDFKNKEVVKKKKISSKVKKNKDKVKIDIFLDKIP